MKEFIKSFLIGFIITLLVLVGMNFIRTGKAFAMSNRDKTDLVNVLNSQGYDTNNQQFIDAMTNYNYVVVDKWVSSKKLICIMFSQTPNATLTTVDSTTLLLKVFSPYIRDIYEIVPKTHSWSTSSSGSSGQNVTKSTNEILYSNYDIKLDGVLYHESDSLHLSDIGVPLKFKYFTPALIREAGSALSGTHYHDDGYFMAEWDNADSSKGYNVQLQYKGTYKVKKDWSLEAFSPYETYTSNWVDVAELNMNAYVWYGQDIYVDYGNQSPVYLNLVQKAGYTISASSMKMVEGVMRIRYVERDLLGNVVTYGKWTSSFINEKGTYTGVTDEDGNFIPSEE